LARAFPSGEAAPPRVWAGGAADGLGQLGERRECRRGAISAKGEIAAPSSEGLLEARRRRWRSVVGSERGCRTKC
jgi:hypothetical protein